MFFIFFTQVLLLKTNEYKARKKFKNLQLVGLIKYIKNDLIKNMAIEQTLFFYSTLSPSTGSCTRPVLSVPVASFRSFL